MKKYEKCILSFSDKYKIPFVTYTAEELKGVSGEFLPSDFVKSVTGVDNVCERSAVLGSGNGQKILSKASGSGVTAALAMKDWKCKFWNIVMSYIDYTMAGLSEREAFSCTKTPDQ